MNIVLRKTADAPELERAIPMIASIAASTVKTNKD
jgi:hypothetical protein